MAVLLAAVALVNLWQFRGIELARVPEMRAADRYNTADLGSIAYTRSAAETAEPVAADERR